MQTVVVSLKIPTATGIGIAKLRDESLRMEHLIKAKSMLLVFSRR